MRVDCVGGVAGRATLGTRHMDWLLRLALQNLIHTGNLRVTAAGGTTYQVGDGTGAPMAIRFTTHAAERGVLLDPELKFGEAFVDGGVVVEQGSIADILCLLGQNNSSPLWARPQRFLRYLRRRLTLFNSRPRARRNAAHHYDIDDRLYALFLDADRQYSCAYFERPDQTLDDAQLAKKRHVAAKLLLAPGQRVLDIGSGWGGLALYLAQFCQARVTGITLSKEQLAVAKPRAGERGLSDAVTFALEDYRDVSGTYDHIVSVGMFEPWGSDSTIGSFRPARRGSIA